MLRLNDQAEGLRVAQRESSRVMPLRRSTTSTTHTIAITSGKGGVGKTQIAANVAVTLAQQGAKVVMLDADLGLASLDLALGLQPSKNLMSVVNGECSVEDILLEGPCGVQLMPACPGRYEMANLGSRERNLLLNSVDEVARRFDVLIIDTGAGIGPNSIGFAAAADEVLLIATPDPTSLRDAYATAKVLNRRSGVESIKLIANQVGSEAEGVGLHARIDTVVRRFLTLNLEFVGSVPRDEAVREAVAAGQPYVLRTPRSAAARAIEGIVRRLGANAFPRELC